MKVAYLILFYQNQKMIVNLTAFENVILR